MPRSQDSSTDTYLDVLRTLGVTDALLRRHHGAGPETSLRVAIDGDRGSPTADLLAALDATGRVLDLRDGVDAEDGPRLTASLARFGYVVECSAAADDAARIELRLRDAVTGTSERLETARDPEAVEATLRECLPDGIPIEFLDLLDGRTLVAERRELESLAASYGPRIEPFDDSLLAPDDEIEVDDPSSGHASPTDDPFDEVVADADDETAESIEAALAEGGPSTHTIEDDRGIAEASTATIGGGPRRTVSTTGIDEVFDQLESATDDAAMGDVTTGDATPANDAATDGTATDDSTNGDASTTTRTMSDSVDSTTDATESTITDDATHTPNGLTGGPTRTVSTTSADDILDRATGDSDFDAIADEEGEADPDAVLADAEGVPAAIEDDVASEVDASGDAEPSDETETPDETDVADDAEAVDDAQTGEHDADESPANGDAAEPQTNDDTTDEPTPSESAGGATPPSVDPSAPEPATADGDDPDDVGPETRLLADAATGDAAYESPDDEADAASHDEAGSPEPSSDGPGLGDDLVGNDVELRRGTESVDGESDPAPDRAAVEAADDESADADGPLAAAGGVGPANATSTEDAAETADGATAASDSDGEETDDDPDGSDGGLVSRITSMFGR